ncbi:MAG: helix-turn-helix domain-containing protein [Spirochaetes bacterium]|nr:helix-turn-helix domain-containing protein [Spirochaetota bacterium]
MQQAQQIMINNESFERAEKFLTVDEACEYLKEKGLPRSKRALYGYTRKGQLPYIKFLGSTRFTPEGLEQFVRDNIVAVGAH